MRSHRPVLWGGLVLYTINGIVAFALSDVADRAGRWVVPVLFSAALIAFACWRPRVGLCVLCVLSGVGALVQLIPPTEAWRLPLALIDGTVAVVTALTLKRATDLPARHPRTTAETAD